MTITYPLTFPTALKIKSVVLSLMYVNSQSKSPYTKQRQAFPWGGEMWAIDCNMVAMIRADAEEWMSFANKLRGNYGTFLFGDPSAGTPRGTAGGTPLVMGGGQTGYELIIDGAPLSTTDWLKKGDYYQLGTGLSSRMHKLVENANTNGSGQVTLEFVPAIITAPADNAPLVITNAKGLFHLVENSVSWSVDENGHYRYNFKAEQEI